MLDHQDRAPGADAADQFDHAIDVGMGHAGGRLVEQQHLRVERERGRDLQGALLAVGELAGSGFDEARQPDVVEQRMRAVVQVAQRLVRPPEIERVAARALQREPDVLQRGELGKHRRDLEAADQPQARDLRRLQPGDVAALEDDAPARRRQELGQQVEAGGLAGPVGADQGVDGPRAHLQRHVIDGDEAAELARQASGFQDDVGHPWTSPLLV